jgi:hypothetical protein
VLCCWLLRRRLIASFSLSALIANNGELLDLAADGHQGAAAICEAVTSTCPVLLRIHKSDVPLFLPLVTNAEPEWNVVRGFVIVAKHDSLKRMAK